MLRRLRATALPTSEELEAFGGDWAGSGRSERERSELRDRARRLLTERGMPVAVNSVVGKDAGAEALARVFDALQVERVARGLVFGVVLQGVRGLVT